MGYMIFSAILVLFVLWCTLRQGSKADDRAPKFDRNRIVNHRDKKTLIISDTEPASDDTQVKYFATGKGYVNADKIQ